MSSDVILYCEQLKIAFHSKDTKKVSINLDAIGQYFNDRISESEIGSLLLLLLIFFLFIQINFKFFFIINSNKFNKLILDLAIDKVLSGDGGVLGFVKLCQKQCKTFRTEVVRSFELFVKIIELYPQKILLYAKDIVIVSSSKKIYNEI